VDWYHICKRDKSLCGHLQTKVCNHLKKEQGVDGIGHLPVQMEARSRSRYGSVYNLYLEEGFLLSINRCCCCCCSLSLNVTKQKLNIIYSHVLMRAICCVLLLRDWFITSQQSVRAGGESLKGSHSLDLEDGKNHLQISAPCPLKTTYRLIPLSAKLISMDTTF
jgi:hypothetical protein